MLSAIVLAGSTIIDLKNLELSTLMVLTMFTLAVKIRLKDSIREQSPTEISSVANANLL